MSAERRPVLATGGSEPVREPKAPSSVGVPAAVRALVAALPSMTAEELTPAGVPARTMPGAPRSAAVLVLLSGAGGGGPHVTLIERSARGVHGGQAAFPGGGTEPGDASPVATALREAAEEVRLDPAGVTVLGVLPALPVPVSGYLVTPVLAWRAQHPALAVGDPDEVVAVHRVPLVVLADPAHRVSVRSPLPAGTRPGGAQRWTGPGFTVDGLLVWGFTALLLDALLRTAGLERSWRHGPVIDAPAAAPRSGP